MTAEDQHVERKSLRLVTGRSPDWHTNRLYLRLFRQRRRRATLHRDREQRDAAAG